MHKGKLGRIDEPYFDGRTGWLPPEYSGGSNSGGGTVYSEPPLVEVDFPQEYATTNITDTAIVKPPTIIVTDSNANAVAKVVPVNQFNFEQIKQTIKDNPLMALAVVGVVGYLVFRKGGK